MAHAVSPQALDEWKRLYECWNSGDFDEMLDMYAEDAIFDVSAVFTDIAPVRGHADIRGCWDELYESLDGLRMYPVEVFSLGSGRYVADMRLWGKGNRSGVEVDQRFVYLSVFREDGKCLISHLLPDTAAALAIAQEPYSRSADSTRSPHERGVRESSGQLHMAPSRPDWGSGASRSATKAARLTKCGRAEK